MGPKPVVTSFVAGWKAATGRRATRALAERIFRLARVIPPPATAGSWRLARDGDESLLAAWVAAFQAEALPPDDPSLDVGAMVERWVRGVGRTAYLWEVDGRVVSLVAAGSPTPSGVRIGPVYTPPEERRHGYATALTAAASQHQLDRGRRFCFLFTDLANPTSNRIYRSIGYEPVTDVDEYRFSPP
jgi:GNAT superfamily N-acetyltransferase